ncbi:8780_t:CDS:2, partial [Funneliformis geosporum]
FGVYGIYQVTNFTMFINMENIVMIEPKTNVSFPGCVICPESNVPNFIGPTIEKDNLIDPPFSITCGKSTCMGLILLRENAEFTQPICNKLIQRSNSGCLKFRPNKEKWKMDGREEYEDNKFRERESSKSFFYFNILPKNGLTPDEIPTIYFDQYNDTEKNYLAENYKGNFFQYYMQTIITTGERTILEFPVIHRFLSTFLMGQLSSRPDNTSVEISVNQKFIPLRQPFFNGRLKTQFVIMPGKRFTREEMENYEYQSISIVLRFGVFYGAIAAIYFFLFAMYKVMFQKVVFRCWPFRRSFKKHLVTSFVSAAGVPLGENINDRDYYLDSYYLDVTKRRYYNNEYVITN